MKVFLLIALFGLLNWSALSSIIPCGNVADPREHAYEISLYYGGRICGGSIISSNKVITAATCCSVGNPGSFKVRAGEFANDGSSQEVSVSRVTIHPSYDSNTLTNDVCVLSLATELDITGPYVGTIEMANANDPDPAGSNGLLSFRQELKPPILKYTNPPIITNAQCALTPIGGGITSSMICTEPVPCPDSCQGNTGVGLTSQVSGMKKIVGISSWGYGCSRPGYPDIFTRVSHFVNWINSI